MKTKHTLLKSAVVAACAGIAGSASAAILIDFNQQSAFIVDGTTPEPVGGDFGVNTAINDRVTGWESIWWPANQDPGGRGTESIASPINTTDPDNPTAPTVEVDDNGTPEDQGAVSALKVVGETGVLEVPEDGSLSDAVILSYVYHRNNPIQGDSPDAGAISDSTQFQIQGGTDIALDEGILPFFFNETSNDGVCEDDAPNLTNCDDLFTVPIVSLDPVPQTLDGQNFEFVFDIAPGTGAITNLADCRADPNDTDAGCFTAEFEDEDVPFFTVWTGENQLNFLNITVAARLVPEQVPAPGALSLFGLGLAGLGAAVRRRRKAVS